MINKFSGFFDLGYYHADRCPSSGFLGIHTGVMSWDDFLGVSHSGGVGKKDEE